MNNKKILVVEDDEFLFDAYRLKLEKENFEVAIAHDGEECLKLVNSFKPDLIILDIVMPKMDGIETLRRLKKNSLTSSIPVIVASNLDQPEKADECKRLGALDYFVKSNITINSLAEKCRSLVS